MLDTAHRRRKPGGGGGGGGGAVGALAPTTRAIHPMVHHMKFMNKCSYKACSAYLTAYFSLNLSQKHLPASPRCKLQPDSAKMGVV